MTPFRIVEDEDLARLTEGAGRMLGPDVRARAARLEGPIPRLPREEAIAVERAVEKRQREFATGRVLARALLAEIGRPTAAIARRPDRSPIWPAGAWGSITHTNEAVVVAVAPTDNRTFGLDLEGREPLAPDLVSHILRPEEQRALSATGDLDRIAKVVFSAKEAFYKAQHRHTGVLLDFLDVSLELDPRTRAFEVRVHHPAASALPDPAPRGAWLEVGPFVLAGVRLGA